MILSMREGKDISQWLLYLSEIPFKRILYTYMTLERVNLTL